MRSAIFIATILIFVVVVTILTGCAPSSTPTAPEPVGGQSGYTLEYVELPSGQVLECLFYQKGASYGAMSCDWNEVSN